MKILTLIKVAKSILGKLIRNGEFDNQLRGWGRSPKYKNGKLEYRGGTISLKDHSGRLTTSDSPLSTNVATVRNITVKNELRNKGLARKMYGRAAHEAKKEGFKFFSSDSSGLTSFSADKVWQNLKKRGYPVTENKYTFNGTSIHREHPIFGKAKYIMNLNKLKDGRV